MTFVSSVFNPVVNPGVSAWDSTPEAGLRHLPAAPGGPPNRPPGSFAPGLDGPSSKTFRVYPNFSRRSKPHRLKRGSAHRRAGNSQTLPPRRVLLEGEARRSGCFCFGLLSRTCRRFSAAAASGEAIKAGQIPDPFTLTHYPAAAFLETLAEQPRRPCGPRSAGPFRHCSQAAPGCQALAVNLLPRGDWSA